MADFALMHGGGQGGWVWDETIAALVLQSGTLQSGGAVRSLALDAPGCGGKRGRDTTTITFDEIVRELVSDVEAAGLRDVVLVGHSQAGTVLPAMAALRPDLFRKLVYVSCIAPDPGLTVIEMSGQRLHGARETAAGRALNDPDMPMDERNRLMFCNDMQREQADAFLAKLGQDGWPSSSYAQNAWRYDHLADHPSSYVLCLDDAILPPEWQASFAERLHCGSVIRIDAGHQVMNTRPHALAEVLLAEAAIR
jgi:pimeloyl-ACP methyl ester carboxylesterase